MTKRITVTGGEVIFSWRIFWGPVSAAFWGLGAFIVTVYLLGAVNWFSGDEFFTWLFGPVGK
jgi:hypothetical protein